MAKQGEILARQGEILSKYGKYYDYIVNIAEYSNWTMPLLKDVVPEKKDQALIFREMNALNFRGTAVDYLCWLSLARCALSLRGYFAEGDISIVKWIRKLIEVADSNHDQINPNDMCNVLRSFAHSQYFYFYWEYEIDCRSYPFQILENEDNHAYMERSNLFEMVQSDAMLSAYFELMWWERTCVGAQKHPDRAKIFSLIDSVYGYR